MQVKASNTGARRLQTSRVRWRLANLATGLSEYKAAWDRLNTTLYRQNPYFDSDFIEPLLLHFGSGREKLAIAEAIPGDPIGLAIIRPESLMKWTVFHAAQAQITPVMVSDASLIPSLVRHLPTLALDIPLQDPAATPLEPGGHAHARTISIRTNSNFEDYWAGRSRSLRKALERRRRLCRESGIVLDLLSHTDRMSELVSRFGELEAKGWKGRTGTAVGHGRQRDFYSDVMSRFAERGRALVYELQDAGTTVAMQLAIRSDEMLVLLKSTYDERYANYSPGKQLKFLLLREEFRCKKSRQIEYYTDADAETIAWATDERTICHHMVFRNQLVKKAYEGARFILRPARQ